MVVSSSKVNHYIKTSLVCGAVVTVLWIAAWFVAVAQYHSVIDGWIATQRAAGYQVSYENRMTVGFPHHIMLRFDNLRWKNNDGILFSADHMFLSARPWQWQKFRAKFKGHVEIAAPLDNDPGSLVLGGEEGHAFVDLNYDGTWKASYVALDHAHIGLAPNYVFSADSLEASALRPDTEPKDRHDTGLTLEGQATNITVPPNMREPFGPMITTMAANFRVMDHVPDFRKKQSMNIWNQDSGVVEFDKLHMEWGLLNVTAKGTLGFDDDLQPEGAFSSSLGGYQIVLKALKDYGFIAPRQEAMMDSALTLFAKPTGSGESAAIDLPITVQLGGVFFGPLKIFGFPEIQWASVSPP